MIVVVLHQPQQLPNIAHVVRAMRNFGFAELRLVAPAEYDAYRIEGIAHRSSDVLERVRLYDDLAAALADCVHVAAFTSRGRTAKRSQQRPREAAAEVQALAEQGAVALLFGREDVGLPNEALDLAHRLVVIPTNPDYASLNLGHAVAITLYELALARGAEAQGVTPPRRRAPPATAGDLEQLFRDIESALREIGFFKYRSVAAVMRTMREVLHRAPLDQREAKLLRAMAIETTKYGERLARSRLQLDGE
jgi:TrmH family RNA methyltransferase